MAWQPGVDEDADLAAAIRQLPERAELRQCWTYRACLSHANRRRHAQAICHCSAAE